MASRSRDARLKQEEGVLEFLRERAAGERKAQDAKRNSKVSTAMVRETLFKEDIEAVLTRVFAKPIVKPAGFSAKKKTNKVMKRILNLALSDLHFHSLLDPREVPTKYGANEEARRLAWVILQATEYKTQYRDNTNLFVHIFGDIILGELHDPREGANLTDQFGAAVYLFIQAIHYLAAHFPHVTVRCVPGNHGRRKNRHHDRATSEKWDSFENMIYFATKMGTANLPNVDIQIPYTPYYVYQCFDKRGFVTHGDTVLEPGFPSESIAIKKLRGQINEWNAGEEADKCDLFMVGHVHTGSLVQIPTGPVFVSNGCLIPADPYAISRMHKNSNCGQWLWESTEGHISGDSRYIKVGPTQDANKSLEAIVAPYKGFASPLIKTVA